MHSVVSWFRSLLTPTAASAPQPSVFVSYAREDEQAVTRLVAELQQHRIHIWFAPSQLALGDRLDTTIRRSIDRADYVLVALSRYAVNSPWVSKETEYALRRAGSHSRPIIIPLYMASRDTPATLREHKALDLRDYSYTTGIHELIDTLHGRFHHGQTPLSRFERFVDSLPLIEKEIYESLVSAAISLRVHRESKQILGDTASIDAQVTHVEERLREAAIDTAQLQRMTEALHRGSVPLPALKEEDIAVIRKWLRLGSPTTRSIAASLYDLRVNGSSGQVPSRALITHWCDAWVARSEISKDELPDVGTLIRHLADGRLIAPIRIEKDKRSHEPIEAAHQFEFGDWLLSVGKAAYLFDIYDPERPSDTYPIGRYINPS